MAGKYRTNTMPIYEFGGPIGELVFEICKPMLNKDDEGNPCTPEEFREKRRKQYIQELKAWKEEQEEASKDEYEPY